MTKGTRRVWVVSVTPWPLFTRERPGTHCTEGWVGPRAGLDKCGKSRRPTGMIRSPDSPARRQSLYRLSYPAHWVYLNVYIIFFSFKTKYKFAIKLLKRPSQHSFEGVGGSSSKLWYTECEAVVITLLKDWHLQSLTNHTIKVGMCEDISMTIKEIFSN